MGCRQFASVFRYMKKTTHHRHLVVFSLMVLEEIPRTASGGLVSEAGQQGSICPCYICPFGGDANITKPSFDDVLFALSFSPGWRQGVFLPSFVLWIFFSVFLPTSYLRSCAYSILFLLACWPVSKGGTLCSSLPAAVPVLTSARSCFWCTSTGRQWVHSRPDSCGKCSYQCRRDATDIPERCFLNC